MALLDNIISTSTNTVCRAFTNGDTSQKEIQCTDDEKPSKVDHGPENETHKTPNQQRKLKDIIKEKWKFLAIVVLLLPTISLLVYSLLSKQGVTIVMPVFIYPGFLISGCSLLIGTYRRGPRTVVKCIPSQTSPKEELNIQSETSITSANDVNIANNVHINLTNAPPPPPPPPSPVSSSQQLRVVECRKLLWDVVGRESARKSALWNEMSTRLSVEEIIDIHELTSLFGINKSPTTATKPAKTFKAKQSIMSTKKKLNLAISMAHTKLSKDEILDMLMYGKPGLPIDLLENLLKFAPTELEECALRKQGEMDCTIFGDVEMFFYKVVVNIPTYKERMRTMLLKAQLKERISHIAPYLQTIITASNEVKQNTMLKDFLQFVLIVGNFMNRTKTRGFKISFLSKLISIKSTDADRKTTFLDFIVKSFMALHPNMVKTVKEMPNISVAAKINLKHLEREIEELSGQYKLLERDVEIINNSKGLDKDFKENIKTFVNDVNKEFQSLVELKIKAVSSVDGVLEYFGEGQGTMTNEQLFEIIATFLRQLQESLKRHR